MSETSLPWAGYPLLDALIKRRSRRFGLGMKMASGPLAYDSRHRSFPLTEEEEALLTFAAGGITGFALLDLSFAEGQGGAIVARALGRTIASGDAIQTVSLVVINDDAAYLIKRPQDFPPQEIRAIARPSAAAAVHRAVSAHASQDQRRPRGASAGAHVQRQREPLVSVCPGNDVFFADQRVDFHVHQRIARRVRRT